MRDWPINSAQTRWKLGSVIIRVFGRHSRQFMLPDGEIVRQGDNGLTRPFVISTSPLFFLSFDNPTIRAPPLWLQSPRRRSAPCSPLASEMLRYSTRLSTLRSTLPVGNLTRLMTSPTREWQG